MTFFVKKKYKKIIIFFNFSGLNCKSDFCEEVMDLENNPKNFVPYQYPQVNKYLTTDNF